MSALDIWMPLYIGDYLGATQDLTLEQSGAYLHLLMRYWVSGPVPDDDGRLAMICRVPKAYFTRHIGPAIRPYFTASDGLLRQARADKERERREKISEKRAENGRKPDRNTAKNTPHEMSNINGVPIANGAAKSEQTPRGCARVSTTTTTDTESERKKEDALARARSLVSPSLDLDLPPPAPPPAPAPPSPPKPPPQKRIQAALPDWLPSEVWAMFVAHRNKIRKPMTDHAKDLMIKKLDVFRNSGFDPAFCLNKSIISGWSDIYEPKNGEGLMKTTNGVIKRGFTQMLGGV